MTPLLWCCGVALSAALSLYSLHRRAYPAAAIWTANGLLALAALAVRS